MSQALLEANDFIMQKKILSTHEHYDFLDLQGNKLGEADGNLVQSMCFNLAKESQIIKSPAAALYEKPRRVLRKN
jgi:hypothetical protein